VSDFYAGKFFPPNPNSRVWKAGGFVNGITSTGPTPEKRGLIEISDVNDLQEALDSKSDVGHHHALSDIHPTPIAESGNIDGGTFP
jgi:hypothetical protein